MAIISSKKRIRKAFQPLTTAASVRLGSPGSGMEQVFNALLNEYDPDRTATPLVLYPEVQASAIDGSWEDLYANAHLASYSWYVDGTEISTLSDWTGLYTINTSQTTDRGTIVITRNLAAGEHHELQFRGKIYDHRLGINVDVQTAPVLLCTHTQSEDSFSLSIGEQDGYVYDPFLDRLADYDYEVAQGLRTVNAMIEASYTDAHAWRKEIDIYVSQGERAVTSGFSLELWKRRGVGSYTRIAPATDLEFISLTPQKLVLDLRVVDSADYSLRLVVGSKVMAQRGFSVKRKYPEFFIRPASEADYHPSDRIVRNTAMMQAHGRNVKHPERVCDIQWYTDTGTLSNVAWQQGDTMIAKIEETGAGFSRSDSEIDVYFMAGQKGACKGLASDSVSSLYTDGDGNVYITD